MALWRDIRMAVADSKVPLGITPLQTRIDLTPKWYAFGLSTDVPEHFQGIHGSKWVIVIADESSGIPDPIFESIDGILAGGKAKLIMIGNPNKNTGRFAESFKDPTFHKIHISAFDTPNVKEHRIVVPGLVTWDWVQEMKLRYGEDSDPYRVRVLGEFPKGGEDVLIPIDDVEQAVNRTQEQHGLIKLCLDVARFGSDANAMVIRQGLKVIEVDKWYGLDTTKTVGKFSEYIEKYKSAQKVIAVDDGGVGGGVVDMLRSRGYPVNAILFGSSPTKAEYKTKYRNLRAEMYWNLRSQIKELDLPKHEDWYQACNIKYNFVDGMVFEIEKKQKMKSRGLPSPDLIDALAMSCYPFEELYEQRFQASTHFSI